MNLASFKSYETSAAGTNSEEQSQTAHFIDEFVRNTIFRLDLLRRLSGPSDLYFSKKQINKIKKQNKTKQKTKKN